MSLTDLPERRQAPRIAVPFPALVRWIDQHGERCQERTTIDQLSARGASLVVSRPLEAGMPVFLVVQLSYGGLTAGAGPRVAARGVTIRVDARTDARWGVAVAFQRHRFLYLVTSELPIADSADSSGTNRPSGAAQR